MNNEHIEDMQEIQQKSQHLKTTYSHKKLDYQ